jgi:hypothetical protein
MTFKVVYHQLYGTPSTKEEVFVDEATYSQVAMEAGPNPWQGATFNRWSMSMNGPALTGDELAINLKDVTGNVNVYAQFNIPNTWNRVDFNTGGFGFNYYKGTQYEQQYDYIMLPPTTYANTIEQYLPPIYELGVDPNTGAPMTFLFYSLDGSYSRIADTVEVGTGITLIARYEDVIMGIYPRKFFFSTLDTDGLPTPYRDNIDLSDRITYFVGNPENLGEAWDMVSSDSQNGWKSAGKTYTNQTVSLDLWIKGYEGYNKLTGWLEGNEDDGLLFVEYNKLGRTEWYATVTSLTKSELKTDSVGWFKETLEIQLLSKPAKREISYTNDSYDITGFGGNIDKTYIEFHFTQAITVDITSVTLTAVNLDNNEQIEEIWTGLGSSLQNMYLHYSSIPSNQTMYYTPDETDTDVGARVSMYPHLDVINSRPIIFKGRGHFRVFLNISGRYWQDVANEFETWQRVKDNNLTWQDVSSEVKHAVTYLTTFNNL